MDTIIVSVAQLLRQAVVTGRLLYNREPADVVVVNHDAALAIKVSFSRPTSSGSRYDGDIYGGQQYAPLLRLEVPG